MTRLIALLAAIMFFSAGNAATVAALRVGAASVALEADDLMPIAGGILARFVKGQEGELRATAFVLEKPGSACLAIVSCDVLMLTRDLVDPVVAEIEESCGIPAANVLVHTTHTHHAPSTIRVHGYGRDETFCRRMQEGIVKAVAAAKERLADSLFTFQLGQEGTVGINSRLRLADGTIYWTGPRDDAVGPSGPFDPDLPVLAFRSPGGQLQALLYGHSTHTIGALDSSKRSPAFYGLVAQDLEKELGGTAAFLEGASGSTHNYLPPRESFARIKQAVLKTFAEAQPRNVDRLAAMKRPFTFRVRTFDEAAEEKAVGDYCNKRLGRSAEPIIEVFRKMRKELASQQGDERITWLQVLQIGDVALAAVPAEFFTKFGLEIKKRSPFASTVVVELSNDWIGYLPDREAHQLGGYQVWTGLHSYAEPGTGERIVDEVISMLEELKRADPLGRG